MVRRRRVFVPGDPSYRRKPVSRSSGLHCVGLDLTTLDSGAGTYGDLGWQGNSRFSELLRAPRLSGARELVRDF